MAFFFADKQSCIVTDSITGIIEAWAMLCAIVVFLLMHLVETKSKIDLCLFFQVFYEFC